MMEKDIKANLVPLELSAIRDSNEAIAEYIFPVLEGDEVG